MESSLWDRLRGVGRTITAALRFMGVVRRHRKAWADRVRRLPTYLRPALWGHVSLLFLVGMTTAGMALLPVGLALLASRLLTETRDRLLVGGLILCAAGLLYVLLPFAIIRLGAQVLIGQVQGEADRLADRIEGS